MNNTILNTINDYNNKIVEANNSINKYKSILEKLRSFPNDFSTISHQITSSKNNYLKGGFIDNGETYDKGLLTECNELLNTSINSIDNICTNIEVKITELYNDIDFYNWSIKELEAQLTNREV